MYCIHMYVCIPEFLSLYHTIFGKMSAAAAVLKSLASMIKKHWQNFTSS